MEMDEDQIVYVVSMSSTRSWFGTIEKWIEIEYATAAETAACCLYDTWLPIPCQCGENGLTSSKSE